MLELGMCSDFTTRCFKHTISVVASTAAIIVLLVLPLTARALSCAPRTFTLSEAYDAADNIIVGLVTECEEEISREPWSNGGSDCSFVSLEVLKESKSARDYSGIASSSGCGLSLRVGNQYLLFLDSENKPMYFSAGLNGEPYLTQFSSSYVRILREYRDAVVRDLSEPWIFREYEGACSLSHIVGGQAITFSRATPDVQERSMQGWTRETVDGKTVYRSSASSAGANSVSPSRDMDVVVTGNMPEYLIGVQMLSISFQERPPAPERQATISVGSQRWQLYRMESAVSIGGMPMITQVSYQVGGELSEQVLSAMSKPSDVVVSAVLVNPPIVDSEPPPDTSQIDRGSVSLAVQGDDYFSQYPPEPSQTKPSISPSFGRASANRVRTEPAEPVIRLETRSTQLPAALESYQACYEEVQPKAK